MRNKTKLLGILNLTSDSFSDGGKFINFDNAKAQIDKMIDVSTKNGAIASKIVGSGGGGAIVSLSNNILTSNKIVSELQNLGVKDVFIAKKGIGPTIIYE